MSEVSPATKAGEAIPVTVVAGYLGAGKTTWLNRHLQDGAAPNTLVLVNDFGAINVDSALIEYRGDLMLKLDNGCLCCSLSDALGSQLSRIARWAEPPAALIIETSGVAQPARVADMIRVARQFGLAQIITLVDLGALDRHRHDARIADLVETQIASANVLSLNRGDALTPQARSRTHAWLATLNPGAVREATPGERSMDGKESATTSISDNDEPTASPSGVLTASRPSLATSRLRPAASRTEAEPEWQRFTQSLPPTLDPRALESLLERHGHALARAKGFLQLGRRHYVFHWSGGQASWLPTSPRPGAGQLVGIGFAGPELDTLLEALERLNATSTAMDEP